MFGIYPMFLCLSGSIGLRKMFYAQESIVKTADTKTGANYFMKIMFTHISGFCQINIRCVCLIRQIMSGEAVVQNKF
ncbi:hypothetical protein BH20ACI4_BH20ACI4_24050 [soil metagenome]